MKKYFQNLSYILYKLMILIFVIFSPPIYATTFKFQGSKVQSTDYPILNSIIEKIQLSIPPKYQKNIQTVVITFNDLDNYSFGSTDRSSHLITLNSVWLDIIRNQSLLYASPQQWNQWYKKKINYQDKLEPILPHYNTMKDFLTGVIIHEVSHIYDLLALPPMEYLKTRTQCVYAAVLNEPMTPFDNCDKIANISHTVSDLVEFKTIAGYPLRGFMFPTNEYKNNLIFRTPDPYEQTDTEEAFAVNMEFFLTDKSFQCRRPLLYHYLARHFNWSPFLNTECHQTNKVLLTYSEPRFLNERIEELDFKRLYRIDYLWAGPGPETSSRFGHAMLRFVFCNINRKIIGPDCIEDIGDHRVISFRANVTDFEISSWKGLTGFYSSYLYIIPFTEILKEYTRGEMRDLFALPLNFTQLQKKRMFDLVLQFHWSYRGSYQFLSNNCAHETMTLINSVLFDIPKYHDLFVIKPNSLYDKLLETGIGIGHSANELKQNPRLGLFYSSQFKIFYNLILKLEKADLLIDVPSEPEDKVNYYFSLDIENRKKIFDTINLITDKTKKKQLLYALLALENMINEKLVNETFKAEIPKLVNYNDFFKIQEQLSSPWGIWGLKVGYGIPQKSELESISTSNLDNFVNSSIKKFDEILKMAFEKLDSESKTKIDAQTSLVKAISDAK